MNTTFEAMSSKQLVAFYNNLCDRPVKKFRDKATGVRKCQELSEFALTIKSVRNMVKSAEPLTSKLNDSFNGEEPVIPQVPTRRQAMSSSLQLDRTIMVYADDVHLGLFDNVHQLWKAHPEWVTGAQVDRLTRVLYNAAKAGVKESVTINFRTFELAQSGLKRNG